MPRRIRKPLAAPSSRPVGPRPRARWPAQPPTHVNSGPQPVWRVPDPKPMTLAHGRVVPTSEPDYRWLYEAAAERRTSWLAANVDAVGYLRDVGCSDSSGVVGSLPKGS